MVLEVREKVTKDAPHHFPSRLYRKVILSLQLHEFLPWSSSWISGSIEPSWLNLSSRGLKTNGLPDSLPLRVAAPPVLDHKTLQSVHRLANTLPEVSSEPRNHKERSLHRFGLGASRPESSDAVIDFIVALEGALLAGEREELSYRFSLNGAVFLGESPKERLNFYEDFRESQNTAAGPSALPSAACL
jgi:hypothetical protein